MALSGLEIILKEDIVVLALLILASFRVYLEVIDFSFESLPMTKKLAELRGEDQLLRFHRFGLYLSIGFILFTAPTFLFGS